MRICVTNIYIPVITIRNFITAITYNAAYISIAGYRRTIGSVSNMRVAQSCANYTANYTAAGNAAANQSYIVNICVMRNAK